MRLCMTNLLRKAALQQQPAARDTSCSIQSCHISIKTCTGTHVSGTSCDFMTCWRATTLLFWHMQREKDGSGEVGWNEMNSCHSSYSEGRFVVLTGVFSFLITLIICKIIFEYLFKCENFWSLDYYIHCFSCKLGQITTSVIVNDNQSWCKLAIKKNAAYGSCRVCQHERIVSLPVSSVVCVWFYIDF